MGWLIAGTVLLALYVLYRHARRSLMPVRDRARAGELLSPAHYREIVSTLARLKLEVTTGVPVDGTDGGGREASSEAVTSLGLTIRWKLRHARHLFRHRIELVFPDDDRDSFACDWYTVVNHVLGSGDAWDGGGHQSSVTGIELAMNDARQGVFVSTAVDVPDSADQRDWVSFFEDTSAARQPEPLQLAAPPALSREELEQQLTVLAQQPPVPPPIVTCYAMMSGPPARAEYVCPRCGSRTFYVEQVADFVEREIPAIRRAVSGIGGIAVQVDESQFCRTCSPGFEHPELALLITLKDDVRPRRVQPAAFEDLRLLRSFLRDGELPLDPLRRRGEPADESRIQRLKHLLGLSRP